MAWREFDGEGGYDYRTYDDNENFRDEYIKRNGQRYASWVEPLYTAPPQRQPLTDEEIDDIWNQYCDEMGEASINDAYDIARAPLSAPTGSGNDC